MSPSTSLENTTGSDPNEDAQHRLRSLLAVSCECIGQDELLRLLAENRPILAYDGFEPSGRVHIAQGLLKTVLVNRLASCGIRFLFLIADSFALLNNKMDANLDHIQNTGMYMVEVWKAAGMNTANVSFVFSSDIAKDPLYWTRVIDIARNTSLARAKRCLTVLGREETDDVSAAQILYPIMQCADIFHLGVDICQLGIDQRKVNMLAREQAKRLGCPKPIVLSHPILRGLLQHHPKMSKSIPESAIYMDDDPSAVADKITRAYCPPHTDDDNPITQYYKHIVFHLVSPVSVNGTGYTSYDAFIADYRSAVLSPKDIKAALIACINDLLSPIHNHFSTDPHAKRLLDLVKSYSITR